MKAILLLTVLGLTTSLLMSCPTPPPRSLQNNIGEEEAIKVASQLNYEMHEEDALRFIHQHRLINDNPGAGDSFGWSHCFLLQNSNWLVLVIHPKPASPDGRWINGRLYVAEIKDNEFRTVEREIRLLASTNN
jgi:hypothetical protein